MQRLFAILIILLSFGPVMAGCADEADNQTSTDALAKQTSPKMTMFRGNADHLGVYNSGGTIPSGKLDWRVNVTTKNLSIISDGGWNCYTEPLITDGVVYYGSVDDNFYALDAANGSQKWSFPSKGMNSSPAINEGTVYFVTFGQTLIALDSSTGKEKWSFVAKIDGSPPETSFEWPNFSSSPTIANNIAYFKTRDGDLYAVDTLTGKEKWRAHIKNTEGYSQPVASSSPAVVNGVVYLGTSGRTTGGKAGTLYALDAVSGQEKWKIETDGVMILSSPAVADDVVFVTTIYNDNNQGKSIIYAIDANTGKEMWKIDSESYVFSSPAIADGIVYFGSGNIPDTAGWDYANGKDGKLHAVDTNTGQEKWQYLTGGTINISPAVADGIVYIGNIAAQNSGKLFAIDTNTGKEKWHFDEQPLTSPTLANGVVYFVGIDGYLYAVQ